jgi:hypothetical protein
MASVADFDHLYVVESLQQQELHTGAHLVEEVRPSIERLGFGLTYWKLSTATEFRSVMSQILAQAERPVPKIYPILHLDAHGTEGRTGISLSSGDVFHWNEFASWCREIHGACENNLTVVSSICYGISAITEVSIKQLTPFFSLIGPRDVIKAVEADAMSRFYRELLDSGDVNRALERLPHELEQYLSEWLFLNSFARYIREKCRGQARSERVERLLTEVLQHPSTQQIPIKEMRKGIKKHVKPTEEAFRRWQARFLMADHPNNSGRFKATLADALSLADESVA